MEKRNIIVTGGAGFIGSFLIKELSKYKFDKLIIVDSLTRYFEPNIQDTSYLRIKDFPKNVIFERCDNRNVLTILKIIKKYRPVYIFHLAGVPISNLRNLSPGEASEGCFTGTINILESLNLLKEENKNYFFKKFIYISSSMVYGNFKESKVNENSITNPIEIYGTLKKSGEVITKGLCNHYKIPFNIIRPSAVYGPTDVNKRVIEIFLSNAIDNKEIIVHGGDEKLDFTYVKDLVRGIVLSAIKNVSGETFNITYGKSRKLIEVIKILKKFRPNLKYKVIERDNRKPRRGTLNISKAKRLLGYKPKYCLEKGLSEYYDFLNQKIK